MLSRASRTCRLAGVQRLVRVAAVLPLVNRAVDAADGAVEARLPENLRYVSDGRPRQFAVEAGLRTAAMILSWGKCQRMRS